MNKIIIIEKFNLIKNKNIYILAVILALFSVNLVFSNDNNIEIFDKTENLTREQILEKISIIKDIEKENKIKSKRLKKELKEEKKKLKRLKLDNKDFENENKEITDYIVNENIARDDIELSPEKTSLEEVVTDIWSYDENFLYSNNDLETVPEKKIILESSLIDNKKLKSDNGLFLIYDIFIDENFLINQNDITFLALEKSLLKNYNDIQPIFNNAKDFSIYLNLKGPFLDFLLIQKSIIKNQYKESKENRENNKILKNWQLLNRAIDDKLTIEDKAYILERIRFIPDNKIINENKKINTMYTSLKKLDYEILKSTDLSLIEQYIKNFEKYTDFFEKLLFIQNLIWLDDYSLKDDKLNEILNNDDYEITKKDLTYIINFKKEKLETAVQFFFNLPEKWSFFVSPYYNAKLDILASNSLNNYLKQYLAENIDMVNDASWQVAKSYKSLNNFYLNTEAKHLNHRFPVGIVTDLDFIDKNILKVLAVRDYEIIINKGNFYEYDKAILNGFGKNKKNICLLFENIDFYDTKTSKSEVIIKNFIKDLVKFQNKDIDAVFILSSKKLEKKGFVEQKDYLAFYNLFFSELIKNENIQFISMDEFKEKITNINVIQYNYNGLDEEQELDIEETNNKSPLKTINLDEQEFMISIDSLIKFLDDNKVQEYWVVIKNAKIKLEEKKNKNEINLDLYLETLNDIYKLQNILFLEIINNEKEKNLNNNLQNLRIELLEIYQKLETILGLKINDLQNMSSKNYNNNKKVEEFSNIIIYKDNKGFKIQDSLNDDYGDGNYTYPENENFVNGMLDIKGLNVFNTQKNIVFRVEMRNLHNRQKERIEGSLKNIQLDIYIDTNGKIGSGNTNLLSMRNAFTSPENAWEYCISINGDSTDLFLAQSDDFIKKIATLQTKLDYENNFITVYVPNNILSGDIYSWKYITLSCGYDYNKKIVIKVESQNSDNFFGGRKDLFQPNIIDIILPDGISQHNIFAPKSQIAEIPAIEIKKS